MYSSLFCRFVLFWLIVQLPNKLKIFPGFTLIHKEFQPSLPHPCDATFEGEGHPKGNSPPPHHRFKLPEQQIPLFFPIFLCPTRNIPNPIQCWQQSDHSWWDGNAAPMICPRQLPIPWIPREGSLKPSLLSPHPRVRLLEKAREKSVPFPDHTSAKRGWKTTPSALCLHFNSSPRKKGQEFTDGRKDLLGTRFIPNIQCPIPDF